MFTALSLARAGVAVEVIDEAPRRAGHSYAVGLHARSVLLLEQLGLLESLLRVGQRIDGVMIQSRDEERWAGLEGLAGGGAFGLAVPQHHLEAALEGELGRRGVEVRWNERLADLDPLEDRPAATVDQLVRDSSGYAFAANVTVVGRRAALHPSFVVGADGHRSMVARQLGIAARWRQPSQAFAAFEVRLEGNANPHDLQLLLGDKGIDAVWPLRDGWSRCTFQLDESGFAPGSRTKDRAPWWISNEATRDQLSSLLAERAPWLPAPVEIGWSGLARFERRVAATWGRGRVWLLGDAAHVASPLASHSLNRGLHEADAIAGSMAAVLGGGAGLEALSAWENRSRGDWNWLFSSRVRGAERWLAQSGSADSLLQALPATGDALRELVGRLDMSVDDVSLAATDGRA
jgi:2-polyprenyl-6-methoxyphenol hydroxylase-like FAD-dependent oxidoreductase